MASKFIIIIDVNRGASVLMHKQRGPGSDANFDPGTRYLLWVQYICSLTIHAFSFKTSA